MIPIPKLAILGRPPTQCCNLNHIDNAYIMFIRQEYNAKKLYKTMMLWLTWRVAKVITKIPMSLWRPQLTSGSSWVNLIPKPTPTIARRKLDVWKPICRWNHKGARCRRYRARKPPTGANIAHANILTMPWLFRKFSTEVEVEVTDPVQMNILVLYLEEPI